MLKNRCGFDLTIRNETVLSRIVGNKTILLLLVLCVKIVSPFGVTINQMKGGFCMNNKLKQYLVPATLAGTALSAFPV